MMFVLFVHQARLRITKTGWRWRGLLVNAEKFGVGREAEFAPNIKGRFPGKLSVHAI